MHRTDHIALARTNIKQADAKLREAGKEARKQTETGRFKMLEYVVGASVHIGIAQTHVDQVLWAEQQESRERGASREADALESAVMGAMDRLRNFMSTIMYQSLHAAGGVGRGRL